MVASAMSSYAAEIEGIDGINIEKADYDISRVVDEDTSEGIAKGIEPRGSIIDTAMTSISNLGKGDIGIFIQTLAHVECDKIKNIAVLQREEGGKWVEVSRYTYDASKEDFPTEDLSGMTNDFTVKNQKTGYKYRVVGIHYVESNGKGQSFMTKTKGVCSREINFEVEDNKVKNVQFVGGCSGNTQGVARLIDGMDIDEAISRIEGIQCGFRPTSCPDQLAQALKEYKANVK